MNNKERNSIFDPYCFEPQKQPENSGACAVVLASTCDGSDSDEWDGVDVETEGWRLQSMNWCTCTNCTPLPTIKENLCCREMGEVVHELEGISCITENIDFRTVCLNSVVLRTALIARNDIRHDNLRAPIQNDLMRYQSYRQFTYWVHKRLGYHVRRVIPSCVITSIRKAYPDPQGEYRGFLEWDE